jgi:hypothetical protein
MSSKRNKYDRDEHKTNMIVMNIRRMLRIISKPPNKTHMTSINLKSLRNEIPNILISMPATQDFRY